MSDYWTENGLVKPQQIVVCAACRFPDGLIICGARHWDKVMRAQVKANQKYTRVDMAKADQGFIDQYGDFLSREEAMEVVKQNGQPFNEARNAGDVVLFSEGLY